MDKPTTKELARFLDCVHITKSCWLWTGCLVSSGDGYGQLKYHGETIRAHRFSYRLFVGVIEPGKCILHRRECGNRNCVNPNHLYMGTNADNMRDKVLWGNPAVGERQGSSKLSKEDVLAIRGIHKDKRFGYAATAISFDVNQSTIGRIVRGQRWRHI